MLPTERRFPNKSSARWRMTSAWLSTSRSASTARNAQYVCATSPATLSRTAVSVSPAAAAVAVADSTLRRTFPHTSTS